MADPQPVARLSVAQTKTAGVEIDTSGDEATAVSASAAEKSSFERLAAIRLPLIVLVICYHNESGGQFIANLQGSPVLQYVVNLIANGLGGIRVPVFFLIAGYVFFRNHEAGLRWFAEKIYSRVRSVLLPLILWSVFWLVVIALAQELPFMAKFFGGKSPWSAPVAGFSALRIFQAVLGETPHLFLYHLWFLRDLFILVLLTPLIYQAIRWTQGWVSVFLLLAWGAGLENGLVSRDALFFFFMGCQLSMTRRSIFLADGLGPAAILCWLGLRLLGGELSAAVDKVWILCGVLATLYLSGCLAAAPRLAAFLRRSSRYSFFIFVAHEPALTILRRTYFRLLEPGTPLEIFTAYLLVVALTVAVLILVFCVAERLAPRVLQLVTGGRA